MTVKRFVCTVDQLKHFSIILYYYVEVFQPSKLLLLTLSSDW